LPQATTRGQSQHDRCIAHLAPDLEKGWLTVVALNSNSPTQLDSYSNKCGIAMNYCLAAPGDVIVSCERTPPPVPPMPAITSSKALRYPRRRCPVRRRWCGRPIRTFSNYLVRQTLLRYG
jgi:hypothetical protein